MSITLTEQELEEVLSYKDRYEELRTAKDLESAPWSLSSLDDKLQPRIQRAEWVAVSQMVYMLNNNMDAELAGIADIGRNPPTRIRASVEDVEVANRFLRCLYGDVDLVVEVHNPPIRSDPYHYAPPEVANVDSYRPVKGLNVVVDVVDYGRVNPLDLVRIEFQASLSTIGAYEALKAGLDSKFNQLTEMSMGAPGAMVSNSYLDCSRTSAGTSVNDDRVGQRNPMMPLRPRRTIRQPSSAAQRIGQWISTT